MPSNTRVNVYNFARKTLYSFSYLEVEVIGLRRVGGVGRRVGLVGCWVAWVLLVIHHLCHLSPLFHLTSQFTLVWLTSVQLASWNTRILEYVRDQIIDQKFFENASSLICGILGWPVFTNPLDCGKKWLAGAVFTQLIPTTIDLTHNRPKWWFSLKYEN